MILLNLGTAATKPENSWLFMILSEIGVTLIVAFGAYKIFKPVLAKDKKKRDEDLEKEKQISSESKTLKKD